MPWWLRDQRKKLYFLARYNVVVSLLERLTQKEEWLGDVGESLEEINTKIVQGALQARAQTSHRSRLRNAACEHRGSALRAVAAGDREKVIRCWRNALARLHQAFIHRVARASGTGHEMMQHEGEWPHW